MVLNGGFDPQRHEKGEGIPLVDKRVGVEVKLCDPLTMRAIAECFRYKISS